MAKAPYRFGHKIHPGEILKHEFLLPSGLSAKAVASAIGIPANRLTEIIAERRGITADTAIRLARFWGTTVEFWINMQAVYDVKVAEATHDYSAIKRRPAA